MMEKMIAKCGLTCTECEAYIATMTNDIDALTIMANKATEQFGTEFTWEDSICNGCLSDGKKIGYCAQCGVRACAMERGMENCAHCPDYGCETANAFWQHAPRAKTRLDSIRASLN